MDIYTKVSKNDPIFRKAILWVYKNKCFYSKEEINETKFDIDHIIPKAEGGKDCIANYLPTKPSINRRKNKYYNNIYFKELEAINRAIYAPKVLKKYIELYSIKYKLNKKISVPAFTIITPLFLLGSRTKLQNSINFSFLGKKYTSNFLNTKQLYSQEYKIFRYLIDLALVKNNLEVINQTNYIRKYKLSDSGTIYKNIKGALNNLSNFEFNVFQEGIKEPIITNTKLIDYSNPLIKGETVIIFSKKVFEEYLLYKKSFGLSMNIIEGKNVSTFRIAQLLLNERTRIRKNKFIINIQEIFTQIPINSGYMNKLYFIKELKELENIGILKYFSFIEFEKDLLLIEFNKNIA